MEKFLLQVTVLREKAMTLSYTLMALPYLAVLFAWSKNSWTWIIFMNNLFIIIYEHVITNLVDNAIQIL